MDWEESPPPPSRDLFDKNSSSQHHPQYYNQFHHQRLITSSSTNSQNNFSSSGNNSFKIGNLHHSLSLHEAINLSESNSKGGFNIRNNFSPSSTNTSPSGSSTSSSPPLSTSCESNGSSINAATASPIFGAVTSAVASSTTSAGLDSNSRLTVPTTSTSSNITGGSSKKNKPIPPPLDLSIGAANLSLHSSGPDSASPTPINLLNSANPINGSCFTPQFFQPVYYLASPKFNQAEKTLPLRKRWHSWSPLLMNNQDPMLPLYPEAGGSGGNGLNPSTMDSGGDQGDQDQTPTNKSTLTFSMSVSSPSQWASSSKSGFSGPGSSNSAHQSTSSNSSKATNKSGSNELQTPTPFYTPNEPSPKFMNSPVFSYSTPDTSLYQGPFSPRTSTLFPPLLPSSPFHTSSLNTPTFLVNTNGAHNNSSSSFANPSSASATSLSIPIVTVNGNCPPSSSPLSLSSSTSSSVSTTTFSTLVPSTMLSPASSQASSSNSVSYEDLHEKSSLSSLNNLSKFTPIWNIFIPGTRIRFVNGIASIDWHLVDNLDVDDYAPKGLEVRTLVVTCSAKERISMTFCPVDPSHPAIEVNCDPGHPFMVEKKGWCAVNPDVFFDIHGIRCQQLECGDVCVKYTSSSLLRKSPHQQHNFHDGLAFSNPNLRNGIKMSSILPPADIKPHLDQHSMLIKSIPKSVSPLAHIPISVVRQKPQVTPNPPTTKQKKSGASGSSSKKSKSHTNTNSQAEPRGRRPMNAFLLFAKDKRPELIQMYPGKDNRSISVLLGEAWQSLGPIEKEQYASSARSKAEEQKRMHPDCWKRKKAQSSTAANSSASNNLNSLSSGNKNLAYSPISMTNYQNQIDEM